MCKNKTCFHVGIALILGLLIGFGLHPVNGLTDLGVRVLAVTIPTLYLWLTVNTGWCALLFLGLLASATCFVTWNRAVFLLGPVRTSVYIYASPVITIIASALILHETMTPVMWVGTALALGGLMLSEKKTKKS